MFDSGLAILPEDAIPGDPSIGRILASRIAPPRTVEMFKRALSKLLGISLSRFASLHLSLDGTEQDDSVMLPWMDDNAPGMSPQQPLVVMLSQIVNGVATPVTSRACLYKLAYPEKPIGWWEGRLISPHTPTLYFETSPESYSTSTSGVTGSPPLGKGQIVYVDPHGLQSRKRIAYGSPSLKIIYADGLLACEFLSTDSIT